MKRLMVLRMSVCPETSSRVLGLYFSTLRQCQTSSCGSGSGMYHGRLSSASTGRSATMRLPLAATLSELNWMDWSLEGGASTSMSSSKSDMLRDDLCAFESREILPRAIIRTLPPKSRMETRRACRTRKVGGLAPLPKLSNSYTSSNLHMLLNFNVRARHCAVAGLDPFAFLYSYVVIKVLSRA